MTTVGDLLSPSLQCINIPSFLFVGFSSTGVVVVAVSGAVESVAVSAAAVSEVVGTATGSTMISFVLKRANLLFFLPLYR